MNLPLLGRRILVTRPAAQSGELAQRIGELGGEPVLFPLLEIGPVDDVGPLQRAIERLDDYALAVFISPNAVDHGLLPILERRTWPMALSAAAIGPSTAKSLSERGIAPVIVPEVRFDSEALLERPELAAARVAGKRVLILRGNGGRELLAETLIARGATVDCVSCYTRSAPADGSRLQHLLCEGRLDALTVSSSEGLRNLLALLDEENSERVRGLPTFVPHARIAGEAASLGLQRVLLTGPADAGIIESLCAYPWGLL